MMVRVVLPYHLKNLAKTDSEIQVEVDGPLTQRTLLDALEAQHPVLKGTIRDHATGDRRPLLRFFTCAQDISHQSPDNPLPEEITNGTEPFMIIGAIAGG